MKGTVAPSSSSAAAAATCASRTPSSCAIRPSIEIVTPAPSYALSTMCGEAERCVRSRGMHMDAAPVILQVPTGVPYSSQRQRDVGKPFVIQEILPCQATLSVRPRGSGDPDFEMSVRLSPGSPLLRGRTEEDFLAKRNQPFEPPIWQTETHRA